MKTKKVMAISLASALLASALAIPASAFTPNSSNFEALFDFDKVPTAQYTLGYEPGTRSDTIGDSKSLKCITADRIGYTYHLEIQNTVSQSGKALKLSVTDNAPPAGEYCPLGFYPNRGENKDPKTPDGYEADSFMYWVDFTGFVDKTQAAANSPQAKGFLFYMQEKDYDAAGNMQEKEIAWRPKNFNNGGYVLTDNGSGWQKLDMNTSNKDSYDFYIPNNFKGWVKIPFSVLELQSGGSWENQHDADGKIDAKCITQISMGSGNYESQSGSVLYFDSFGLGLKKIATSTTVGSVSTTKADKTTAEIASETSDTTESTDTTEAPTTTSAAKITTTTTAEVASATPENKNHTGLIIAIIAIVVVLGGAGTGFFFLNKKAKEEGFSSVIDYFKNRNNSSQQ